MTAVGDQVDVEVGANRRVELERRPQAAPGQVDLPLAPAEGAAQRPRRRELRVELDG